VKSSSGGGNFVIYVENSSGFQISGLYQNSSGHGALFIADSAGSYRAVVGASGDAYILQPLGVGISVPAAQLHVTTAAAATKGLIVKGASAQSANLQDWQDSAGSTLAAVLSNGAIQPASMADSSAANNTIYYSTTASKLVYKNSAGTVNNLY
jgi:hypothetical protein